MSDAPVATTGLSPDGEAAWLRLKLHLEWLDGFDLIFLFSAHAAVVRVLRERLAAAYRARVTGLEVPTPQTPDELMERILPWLLKPPSYQQALNAPVWLDLTRAPAGTAAPDWQRARLDFLARLNERREPLRRALARPLILVLPLAEKAQIKALVPDLWAIRRFSLDLGHWLAPAGAERSPAHPPEKPIPFALSDTEQSQVEEWRRLRGKQTDDRGALVAAARAYDALWRRAQVDTAAEVALWMAESARRILERVGETPEALRDLSVSLDKVGDTDRALGAFEQACAAYEESLDIARRILQRVGETPEALRDLSVSLERLGDTDRALGAFEQARAAYEESLDIRRRILQRVGETPEALRDLSVSLNKVGDTDRALGAFEQARAAYEESLDIRRRILQRVGETPEALRDLSVSLERLGDTDRALGAFEQARAVFTEGLEIAERLAAAMPDHADYRHLPELFRRRPAELDNAAEAP